MGNTLARNRYWWYRSLYDDYMFREMRLTFGVAGLLFLPFYWWGIHINREFEVHNAHINYLNEWGPRRLRLTHSMLFEEFEMDLERFLKFKESYTSDGDSDLPEGAPQATENEPEEE